MNFSLRTIIGLLSMTITMGVSYSFGQYCNEKHLVRIPNVPGCFLKGTVGAFKLHDKTHFKIKVESMELSGHDKRNDIVRFSVLEDVYGYLTEDIYPDKVETPCPAKPDPDHPLCPNEPAVPSHYSGERIVVIPKDTVGYGQVVKSQGRNVFYFKGRAKIRVQLIGLTLASGQKIGVNLAVPIKAKNDQETDIEYVVPNNVVPCDKLKRQAFIIEDHMIRPGEQPRMCVEGRRDRVPLGSAIVSAVVGTILAILEKPEAAAFAVGGPAFLDKASGTSAVGSLLDGVNSQIDEGSVFEVVPTQFDGMVTLKGDK